MDQQNNNDLTTLLPTNSNLTISTSSPIINNNNSQPTDLGVLLDAISTDKSTTSLENNQIEVEEDGEENESSRSNFAFLLEASKQLASPRNLVPNNTSNSISSNSTTSNSNFNNWLPDSNSLLSFQDEQEQNHHQGGNQFNELSLDSMLREASTRGLNISGSSNSNLDFTLMSSGKGKDLMNEEIVNQQQEHPLVLPPLVPSTNQQQPSLKALGKRKEVQFNQAGQEDKWIQIRDAIKGHTIHSEKVSNGSDISTILCLHACVAQKSYGKEKRYQCPPPLVQIEGPIASLKPHLTMNVLDEQLETKMKEISTLDSTSKSYFKGLYLAGTGKDKLFSIQLSLHPPPPPPVTVRRIHRRRLKVDVPSPPIGLPVIDPTLDAGTSDEMPTIVDETPSLPPPFAAFSSSQVTIISKPSKKTAKARNTVSCIFNGSTISLFSRINSQTVRTKFMSINTEVEIGTTTSTTTIEDQTGMNKFCARANSWSAFSIQVLIPGDSIPIPSSDNSNEITVSYGSQIILTDLITGISSDPLMIKKVEKGKVINSATGPVSQLQKIALGRILDDGKFVYLSSKKEGGYDFNTVEDEVEGGDGKRRKLDNGVAVQGGEGGGSRREGEREVEGKALTYQFPKLLTENDVEVHEVGDEASWTVTGITSFSYQFFNAYGAQNFTYPTIPITPFPLICSPPEYDPNFHSVTVEISNFFHTNTETSTTENLEIWLGTLGPLQTTILSGPTEFVNAAETIDGISIPYTSGPRTILSILLPPIEEILSITGQTFTPPTAYQEILTLPPTTISNLENVNSSKATNISYLDALVDSITTSIPTTNVESIITSTPLTATTSISTSSIPAYLNPILTSNPDIEVATSSSIVSDTNSNYTPIPFVTSSFSSSSSSTSRPILPLPYLSQQPTSMIEMNNNNNNNNGDDDNYKIPTSLPIIFIRPSDGTGYMTSRWVSLERELIGTGGGWEVKII